MMKERAAVDWCPDYTVDVREEARETNRYDEDGERIIKWSYYLVATCVSKDPTCPHKYGTRWASGYVHPEEASAKSERRHLPRAFDPVKAGWYEIDPMYGSEAWTPEVEARIAWQEREEEGWNGGYRW